MKKLNDIIFHISTKLPYPIRKTRVSKLILITILCLKFWALSPKFERASLNETPNFPFKGFNICVDLMDTLSSFQLYTRLLKKTFNNSMI